jgi:hypothetical protein
MDIYEILGCSDKIIRHIEINKLLMPLFIDSAKIYLNLSMASLVLTIAFREKVLGINSMRISKLLITSWILFLLAIGFSSLYQYVATKLVEARYNCNDYLFLGEFRANRVYGAMMFSFYLGALTFSISAIRQYLISKRVKA